MLGAILGDIVGSPYEFDGSNTKTTDFPLFCDRSHFTGDTIMTIAVAEGLLAGYGSGTRTEHEIIAAMRKYGKSYPDAGYGVRFSQWLKASDPQPYDSYGNGSAMRVSAVAWLFDELSLVEEYALISALVTHNHTEGIKGAKATAAAIFLARTGKTKDEIRQYIQSNYDYDLSRTLAEIRPSYHHAISCQETVPEAITAFLESESFEDALRKAVSLGGDSNTLAAITGSIAEGFYGIPIQFKEKALSMLDKPLLLVLERYNDFLKKKQAENQKVENALQYAKRMHLGQKRIGGDDYITHPMAVAKILREQLLPAEYQIAGLFHDLLEDTQATIGEITELGGIKVAKAVQLLTKEPGYDMAQYIARIKANPMAKAVKAADRYHNLQSAVVADESFKKKYILESIEWYMDFSTLHAEIELEIDTLAQTLETPIYELLYPFIDYFEARPKFEWVGYKLKDSSQQKLYEEFVYTVDRFMRACYMSGTTDVNYLKTVKQYGIQADQESFQKAIPTADAKLIRALLTFHIRQERFSSGLIASAVENGLMANMIKRLKELQEENT